MTEDSTHKKKSVRIPCAKIVHEYTMATLQRLGNLRCTDVYRSMKKCGGIVLPNQSKAVADIEKLLMCVDAFIPSVPMTIEDVEKSKQFVSLWKRNLQHIRKQIMGTCKPVYLQTEVARVLKERQSKVKFREVMLEWYLSRFGGSDATPEKIADAVIAYDATDWSKVKPLAKGKKGYNIRLDIDTDEEKNLARKYIQWIYKIEAEDIPATLLDDLQNDMMVVKEFEAWRDGEPMDYEYKNTYKEFISRLRTAPVAEKSDGEPEIPKDITTAQQQVSSDRKQTLPADEDPGEEPESFTPEEVDDMHDNPYKDNHAKLLKFLNEKAKSGMGYLSFNIQEERNVKYIRDFASRPDFELVYNTLVSNSRRPGIGAGDIMNYIRDVAIRNITEWRG